MGATPRGDQVSTDVRRANLLDTAEVVFLSQGYRAAPMGEIARRAGMSKKTVYKLFRSKASLFEALLEKRFPVFPITIRDEKRPPEAVLVEVLCEAVNHALASRQIALFRMIVAEGAAPPATAAPLRDLSDAVRCNNGLETWLALKNAAGVLHVEDPAETAIWLFWAAAGRFVLHALLDSGPAPAPAAIETQVRWIVGIFIAASEAKAQACPSL